MALLVYWDNGVERSYVVGHEPVVVGRANECAIRTADGRVSRNHARFYLDQTGMLYVEDLGSSNGVYVGNRRTLHSPVALNEIVVVGGLTFRLVSYGALAPETPPPIPWPQPDTQPVALLPQEHGGYAPTAAYQPYADPYAQQPGLMQPAAPYEPPPRAAQPPAPAPMPSRSHAPSAPPSVQIDWNADVDNERKARLSAEAERDAYGARMAELHQLVRALTQELEDTKAALAAARAELAELPG